MSLDRGIRLGPYEIVAPLGSGGMGEVYRARDTKLGREVAIKILPETFAYDADRMARFDREAKVLASLNHPNIAAIYGVEDRAIVMELVEGSTLAERIAHGAVPLEEALAIARQIAEALEAAHEKGIVHRDLKPANVKVKCDGKVKVLDFGLAKAVEEPSTTEDPSNAPTLVTSQTYSGLILGTAAYMSPEQARGAAVDKRADIWAFGCLLYKMLTGKPAFKGASTSDILAAVLKEEPDWNALPAATPPRIRRLLRRCLERDRKQRLQAIGEARIAIETPEEEVTPQPAASRVWPWVAAVVFAIAFFVAGVSWWRATRPAPLRPMVRVSVGLPPGKTISTNRASQLAVSSDGTRIAVTETDSAGKVLLATRRLDQSEFVPLSGTDGARMPFFSPDGHWIAFAAGAKLKKIAVEGGAPVTLCDAPFPSGASWGDDDTIIAVLSLASGLSRIPAAGGAPASVTQLNTQNGETAHLFPQILPGSRAVLFTTRIGSYEDANIDVLSFKTGERKTVLRGGGFGRYLPTGHLIYLHENRLFAAPFDLNRLAVTGPAQPILQDVWMGGLLRAASFDVSQTGTFAYLSSQGEVPASIFWLDSTGKTQPIHLPPGVYMTPRFSPDGKRLAFAMRSNWVATADIWVKDLAGGTASRLTSLSASNHNIVWTPDGRNIVFESWSGQAPGMYWIRADGSGEPQRLSEGAPRQIPFSFSPDGKRLAYSENASTGRSENWTAPVEGDVDHPRLGKAEPLPRTPFSESVSEIMPAFSPDGRWIAYSSNETGAWEVYVRPFPGPGAKRPISTGGGSFPIWAGNGRELFFLGPDRHIMVAGYTANSDSFNAGKPRVWSERRLADIPVTPYDLAPDGKRFAALLYLGGIAEQEQKPIDSVTVLLNFFDELKRRVPAGGK